MMAYYTSSFLRSFATCFIRSSKRLAGMDGTLGVAPRHAYDTKFDSWLVSPLICGNSPSQTSWGSVEKKGRFFPDPLYPKRS